jgi:hypothetical protein
VLPVALRSCAGCSSAVLCRLLRAGCLAVRLTAEGRGPARSWVGSHRDRRVPTEQSHAGLPRRSGDARTSGLASQRKQERRKIIMGGSKGMLLNSSKPWDGRRPQELL